MSNVDLGAYLSIVWKWLWLIILTTVVAAAVSYRVSQSIPRVYLTSVNMMTGETPADPNVTADDIALSQRLAKSYAQLAVGQSVLSATINALHLPTDWHELRDRVQVSQSDASQYFEIRVLDNNPQRAQLIANEIAKQVIAQSPTAENLARMKARKDFVQKQLDELQASIQQAEGDLTDQQALLGKETSARGVLDRQDEIRALDLKLNDWRATYASLLSANVQKPSNTLTIVDPAYVPSKPVSPNVQANVLTASAVGLLLALGAIVVIESLNDTVKTPGDVAAAVPIPTLGLVGRARHTRPDSDALVTSRDPRSPLAEAFRVIRTNVLLAHPPGTPLTLMVVSPSSSEDRSFIATNLSVSFAQMGKWVTLVDGDLTQPTLHKYLAVGNADGLSNILQDVSLLLNDDHHEAHEQTSANGRSREGNKTKRRIEREYLTATSVPRLRLLSAGLPPSNPTELLASPSLRPLLSTLQDLSDVLIVNGPPVLPTADAAIMAGLGLPVVVVAEAGATRRPTLRLTYDVLSRAHTTIVGVILNRADDPTLTLYQHGESLRSSSGWASVVGKGLNAVRSTFIRTARKPSLILQPDRSRRAKAIPATKSPNQSGK